MESIIVNELRSFAKIMTGKQKKFYLQMIKDAKVVEIASIFDVFTKDEIREIKNGVKPKAKQCFKNASLLTKLFPDKDVKYVEGKYVVFRDGFSTDHAFNKVGDKYVDITAELALGRSIEEINEREYIALCEVGLNELVESELKSHVYGNVYVNNFINGLWT